MRTSFSANLNAVALLRNRRNLAWPSVVNIARIALEAGADGLTVHPRPDKRHIRKQDVFDLAALIRAEFPDKEFNIEGRPTDSYLSLIDAIRPSQATLVPDAPGQSTSEHGWDIEADRAVLVSAIHVIQQIGVRVSVFVDADIAAANGAAAVGADRIELYTGPYGAAITATTRHQELEKLSAAAEAAAKAGLGVNAGHDLTLENLPALRAAASNIAEVSIGQAFTSDALLYGVRGAVLRYTDICHA